MKALLFPKGSPSSGGFGFVCVLLCGFQIALMPLRSSVLGHLKKHFEIEGLEICIGPGVGNAHL